MVDDRSPTRIRSITSALFLVVSLPTGSIFGLNVKAIALGAFVVAFVLYLIAGHDGLSNSEIVSLTLVGASLCFWSLVSVLNGQGDTSEIFYQLRDVASAIIIAWLSIFSIRTGLVRAESLITTVI